MIKEINKIKASFFNLPFIGDSDYEAHNISGLSFSNSTCVSFYSGNDLEVLESIDCGILLVSKSLENKTSKFKAKAIVFATNPKFEFLKLIEINYTNSFEITPKEATINPSSKISSNSYIETKVIIGADCQVYPNVCIFNDTSIGNICEIQAGSVLGAVGLGDIWENNKYNKFVQLGSLKIQNNVSIGSNVSIMRGMLEETIIGEGTKIANNVNIGHSVIIGKNCYISSGVTIGGACVIEDNCWIAIGATINDHVNIKKNSKIGTGSVIIKDTIENGFYLGNPARYISERAD